jgi:hypothetical protein
LSSTVGATELDGTPRPRSVGGRALWTVRAVMSGLLAWTPLMAARGIWRDYRFHRVSLGSLTPVVHATAVEQADLALQSNPDLRIAGAHHYGLICSGNSLLTFRTAVGPSARVRAYCAVMPSAWDRTLLSWDFQITVVGGSSDSAQISRRFA